METQFTPSTIRDIDTHEARQEEYGYLFGLFPIHVNSPFFDLFDYFEYPRWFEEYQKFNVYKSNYPTVVQESVQFELEMDMKRRREEKQRNQPPLPPSSPTAASNCTTSNTCQHCAKSEKERLDEVLNGAQLLKLPQMTAYYGGHLKEPFEPQRGVRRGFENYHADMNHQRHELKLYGEIRNRASVQRPTRMYDGSLTAMPRGNAGFEHLSPLPDNSADATVVPPTIPAPPANSNSNITSPHNTSRHDTPSAPTTDSEDGEHAHLNIASTLSHQHHDALITAQPAQPAANPLARSPYADPAHSLDTIDTDSNGAHNMNIHNSTPNPLSELTIETSFIAMAPQERPILTHVNSTEHALASNQSNLNVPHETDPLLSPNSPTHRDHRDDSSQHSQLDDLQACKLFTLPEAKKKMPLGQHSVHESLTKPGYVNPAFYEFAQDLLPRMVLEFLVPFTMAFNAHVAWMNPVGAWNAAVPALMIYAAMHVSTAHVNTGIFFILIGMVGFQRQWLWYVMMHALGQFAAITLAHFVSPGWATGTIDNVNYVTANTGPPTIILPGALYYNPFLYFVSEAVGLGEIAINFIGRMHMTDSMVSPDYFVATAIWSTTVGFLFRPYFHIAFDGWWGIFNPLYAYLVSKTVDVRTLCMQMFIFGAGPWVGGFIGGSLCRLAFELDQLRWRKFGYFQVSKLLQYTPTRIRDILYRDVAKHEEVVNIRDQLDEKFLTFVQKRLPFALPNDFKKDDAARSAGGDNSGDSDIQTSSSTSLEQTSTLFNRSHPNTSSSASTTANSDAALSPRARLQLIDPARPDLDHPGIELTSLR